MVDYLYNFTNSIAKDTCELSKEAYISSVNKIPELGFYISCFSFLILFFMLVVLPRLKNKTLEEALGIYPLILAMCLLFLSLWLTGGLLWGAI